MKIKATIPKVPANVNGGKALVQEVEYDIPNTQEGLNKKFGADYMLDLQKKALTIQVQAFMRGKMVKREEGEIVGVGLKGAELQAAVGEYKPTLRKAGKSLVEKFREKAATMSAEEKAELLRQLQSSGDEDAPPARNTRAPARQGAAPKAATKTAARPTGRRPGQAPA